MAGIFLYGTSLSQSAFAGNDGLIHHDIEVNNGAETDISFSTWAEILKVAEARGVPQSMWPDYRTVIDLPIDEIIEKNRALREKMSQLGISSDETGTWFDFVVSKVDAGKYIIYVRDY